MSKRTYILSNKSAIEDWISLNKSKAWIARQLHCKIDTLNRYLKEMNISYSGNQSGKGVKTYVPSRYMPFQEYISKSKNVHSDHIRKKLLRDGLKKHECERCHNTHWNGLLIPLEVHHKDGDKSNNDLSNLMMLCPNCHAQTDFYRGRNKNSGRMAK